MPIYQNKSKDDIPRFEKPINEILAEVKESLLSCKYGQSLVIKRKRTPKSQKQLGNIFGNMIDKIIYEANEVRQDGIDGLIVYLKQLDVPKNLEANTDIVKKVLYTVAPTYNEKGEEITLSKMNTNQANDFFERVRDIMAGYVYIPDPNPNWKQEL